MFFSVIQDRIQGVVTMEKMNAHCCPCAAWQRQQHCWHVCGVHWDAPIDLLHEPVFFINVPLLNTLLRSSATHLLYITNFP